MPAWDKPEIRARIAEGLGLGIFVMHKQRYPVRFTEEGGRSYKFKGRTTRYMKRKAGEKGHSKPNVWDGNMMRDIMRPIAVRPLKTQATATGTMRARQLNLSNALGWHYKTVDGTKVKTRNYRRQPDQRAEMEKLIRLDEKIVADASKRHVAQFFNTKGRKKVIKG